MPLGEVSQANEERGEQVVSASDLATLPESVDELAVVTELERTFLDNMDRHPHISFERVERSLTSEVIRKIHVLQQTGGQPDVVFSNEHGFSIGDCSKETPAGRRNTVYTKQAYDTVKPYLHGKDVQADVLTLCQAWGIPLMSPQTYSHLQTLGDFDLNSYSRLQSPEDQSVSIPGEGTGTSLIGSMQNRPNKTVYIVNDFVTKSSEHLGFRCELFVPWV